MLENMTTGEKALIGATAIGIAALVFHKPTRNAVGLSDKLMKNEASEYRKIKRLAKAHNINVKRVGPANVEFSNGVYKQLGNGEALEVLKAQIRVKKKRANRIK